MAEIQIDEPLQAIITQSKDTSPDLKVIESALQAIANALRAKSAGTSLISLPPLPNTLFDC
jgi:hypothetical protein